MLIRIVSKALDLLEVVFDTLTSEIIAGCPPVVIMLGIEKGISE